MSFNKLVMSLCVVAIIVIVGVKGVGAGIDYYNSLPEPELQAQFISAPNGDEVEIPTIKKSSLKAYDINGSDLLECLPDEAFSIVRQGRSLYTFKLEIEGKQKHFMVHFTRSYNGYWNSSIVELKD